MIHTDGSHFIALGSTDRKVHFLNAETAKQEEPVISGHAGSIRCLALDSKRQFVLSGSFDTSIRSVTPCIPPSTLPHHMMGFQEVVHGDREMFEDLPWPS